MLLLLISLEKTVPLRPTLNIFHLFSIYKTYLLHKYWYLFSIVIYKFAGEKPTDGGILPSLTLRPNKIIFFDTRKFFIDNNVFQNLYDGNIFKSLKDFFKLIYFLVILLINWRLFGQNTYNECIRLIDKNIFVVKDS